MDTISRWAPPADRVLRVLSSVLILLVVALAIALVIEWRGPDPFDPLTFEPQRIEAVDDVTGDVRVPTVAGFDGIPAIRLGDPVPVVGVRCSSSDDDVPVTANVWWERTDLRGTRVQILEEFAAIVPPGCSPLRFENEIPEEVARLVAQDDDAEQWRIVGSVTPTAPGGVSAAWQTESFWLLP